MTNPQSTAAPIDHNGFRVRLLTDPPGLFEVPGQVERARSLLGAGELPISRVAAEAGFAHQSHLARHMRRLLGVSPKAMRERLR